MKKYLTLAAFLGAIAFLSISYLAQAEPEAGAALTGYAKDRAECDTLASAPSTEGAAPTEEQKTAALKKCLTDKGHSEEEITKEEAALKAAAPAPAAPPAPEAPAAH